MGSEDHLGRLLLYIVTVVHTAALECRLGTSIEIRPDVFDDGTVESANYPNQYPPANSHCKVGFSACVGCRVELVFEEMFLSSCSDMLYTNMESCDHRCEHLVIWEPGKTGARIFDNSTSVGSVLHLGSSFSLLFCYTDHPSSSMTQRRWRIRFMVKDLYTHRFTDGSSMHGGGSSSRGGERGSFQSPGFPAPCPPSNTSVTYLLTTSSSRDKGGCVRLVFTDFQLHPGNSYVTLYDGSDMRAPSTTYQQPGDLPYIVSSSSALLVEFVPGMENHTGYIGFRAEYYFGNCAALKTTTIKRDCDTLDLLGGILLVEEEPHTPGVRYNRSTNSGGRYDSSDNNSGGRYDSSDNNSGARYDNSGGRYGNSEKKRTIEWDCVWILPHLVNTSYTVYLVHYTVYHGEHESPAAVLDHTDVLSVYAGTSSASPLLGRMSPGVPGPQDGYTSGSGLYLRLTGHLGKGGQLIVAYTPVQEVESTWGSNTCVMNLTSMPASSASSSTIPGFVCSGGVEVDTQCIPNKLTCDNAEHCPNGEDEQLPHCLETKGFSVDCELHGRLTCSNKLHCYSEHEICDGINQCSDLTDEHGCTRAAEVNASSDTLWRVWVFAVPTLLILALLVCVIVCYRWRKRNSASYQPAAACRRSSFDADDMQMHSFPDHSTSIELPPPPSSSQHHTSHPSYAAPHTSRASPQRTSRVSPYTPNVSPYTPNVSSYTTNGSSSRRTYDGSPPPTNDVGHTATNGSHRHHTPTSDGYMPNTLQHIRRSPHRTRGTQQSQEPVFVDVQPNAPPPQEELEPLVG